MGYADLNIQDLIQWMHDHELYPLIRYHEDYWGGYRWGCSTYVYSFPARQSYASPIGALLAFMKSEGLLDLAVSEIRDHGQSIAHLISSKTTRSLNPICNEELKLNY